MRRRAPKQTFSTRISAASSRQCLPRQPPRSSSSPCTRRVHQGVGAKGRSPRHARRSSRYHLSTFRCRLNCFHSARFRRGVYSFRSHSCYEEHPSMVCQPCLREQRCSGFTPRQTTSSQALQRFAAGAALEVSRVYFNNKIESDDASRQSDAHHTDSPGVISSRAKGCGFQSPTNDRASRTRSIFPTAWFKFVETAPDIWTLNSSSLGQEQASACVCTPVGSANLFPSPAIRLPGNRGPEAARGVGEEQEDTSAMACIKLCATATCATNATNSSILD